MHIKHETSATLRFGISCLLLAGMTTGCAMLPPNSFLDPTRVGMFPLEYREGGIRRVLTPREGPVGLANATEPTPEDLVVSYEEYRIGPMDELGIIINDLIQSGLPYSAALEVSPTGYIRLPEIGLLKATGMTERELEQDITARLQEAGLLPNPVVQVFMRIKRPQYFSVIGSAGRPGPYALAQPDTRLLDVLGMVGDIAPLAKKAYVVRRTELGAPVEPEAPVQIPAQQDEGLIIPPPDDDEEFDNSLFARLGSGLQDQPPEEQESPPDERDLEELIAPPGQTAPPTSQQDAERRERRFAPLVFDPTTGTLKEAPTEPAPALEQPPAEAHLEAPAERPEFDWEEVPEYELSQRVIEIDVPALKAGDPRYNIVIRPRDLINIPVDTGVFYMMGEVMRPGVFAFGGREITIKQAIATVGGFGRLAWPSRCEIIRREQGTDKQITIPVNLDHVFAGLEDDLLLRDNDIVNVGTDFIAPFLFVIRNSFRFTYGFGFVYDRNFADKDAYYGRTNPETLEIQRKAQQGLPF
jgi:polysaccharide export outer membrane protein